MDGYLADRKTLAAKTATYNRHLLEHYLPGWLDKPLASINSAAVTAEYATIQKRIERNPRYENSTAKGATTATNVMRVLRVVWNHASADDETLPRNPVQRLTATKSWFPRQRKSDHVPADKIAEFFKETVALANAMQGRYLLFLLFTGLRRNEAAGLQWSEVDPAVESTGAEIA